MTVRATRTTPGVEPADLALPEVAEVLARHGAEAGHYSVLGPDPWRVLWNAPRTGFAPFLETRRCVLAWRSPVAAPEDQPGLLVALVDHARSTGRQLIAMPVNETVRAAGEALGLCTAWVGTECFLDLATWSLAGGRRQKVRWARSHAAHLGLDWREASPRTDPRDRAALTSVEQRWKAARPERATDSFLRTSFEELQTIRRYFVAEGAQGVVASVSCTPINARAWYLQDPVRAPDAPRGALEGAMACALDTFRDDGYDVAGNGPLTFWRPDGPADADPPLGLLGTRVLRHFDHRYRFQAINRFRAKFEPDRTAPIYVVRSHRVITPGVARSLTRLLTAPLTVD
ncbi:MAG: phosphatidylglycerol lysyltransferase domain-containing protein [Acidimicrobiales bacterium]